MGRQEPKPIYPVTYFYLFSLITALCLLDRNVLEFLCLKVEETKLNYERFKMLLRLEWDIFMIRFQHKKYERMAKEILKELDK